MHGPPKIFLTVEPQRIRTRATAGDLRERIDEMLSRPGRLGRVPLAPGLVGWVDGQADDKPWLPLNRQAMDLVTILNGPGLLGDEDATIIGTMVVTGLMGDLAVGLLDTQIALIQHGTGLRI
jgi:hypothetical protein